MDQAQSTPTAARVARVAGLYRTFSSKASGSKRVGWESLELQQKNFHAALDMLVAATPEFASFHDAGCGLGDLVPVLQARNLLRTARYVGSDFVEENLEEARKTHSAFEFHQHDLTKPVPFKAEVTVCLGALAFHQPRTVEAILHNLWAATEKTLVFLCWWNLTPDYMFHEEAEQLRKCVSRFLRESRGAVTSRIGDFSTPVDAMFSITRG